MHWDEWESIKGSSAAKFRAADPSRIADAKRGNNSRLANTVPNAIGPVPVSGPVSGLASLQKHVQFALIGHVPVLRSPLVKQLRGGDEKHRFQRVKSELLRWVAPVFLPVFLNVTNRHF